MSGETNEKILQPSRPIVQYWFISSRNTDRGQVAHGCTVDGVTPIVLSYPLLSKSGESSYYDSPNNVSNRRTKAWSGRLTQKHSHPGD